jgi:Rrf2 family iron-sulfur cluster assembly transcriptional regulator
LGEGTRCMTHDLWTALNVRMVEFLDSVTLQKLVDDQVAKGLHVEDKPSVKRAISAMPISKPVRINAPNSVFALGNVFSKT